MKKIFLFILLLFVSTCIVEGAIPAEERAVLIILYNATNGDSWWMNSGWKTPPLHTDGFAMPGTEDTWVGITVSVDHVTEIVHLDNDLIGSIPPELGDLNHLEKLDLRGNQLSGSIPLELGNLSQLEEINLHANNLSGSIPPELGNLGNLRSLSLGINDLNGSIPIELFGLSHLERLDLASNQLSGSIPSELGNLNHLEYLALNHNQLTGSIPPELGNLNHLEYLGLSYNQLTGSIPPEMGNLSSLKNLSLLGTQLSGSIPPEMGNLNNLLSMTMANNQLSGSIPPELGNLSNVSYISLDNNQLSGSIPSELGNLSNLLYLYLENNQLSGSIPSGLGNLSNLVELDLHGNQLSGSIPSELGNLSNLRYLYLNNNQLSDNIPPELGNNTQLDELFLNDNQLSGSIPPELGNLSYLDYLYLNNNQLSGSIPPELGNNTGLDELFLNDNQLSGSIPLELGNLHHLEVLWLDNNHLNGSIPTQFGGLYSLESLRLNGNRLSGAIPLSFGTLTDLLSKKSDIGYNGLYTDDETLRAFLNSKAPDWEETQTTAPTDIAAEASSSSSIRVSWTPIAYTGDTGGYEVYYSTTSGGGWIYAGSTADKSSSSYEVTGLSPDTLYYFVVKTRTNAHSNNSNKIISDYSKEVAAYIFVEPPSIFLNRTHLNFGYVVGGNVPGSQTFTINSPGGLLNWTASANVSWLNVNPSSGTGPAVVMVSIDPVGLSAGTYIGTITVSDANAGNSPQTVGVDLTVYEPGAASEPFGEFSTPIDGSTVRSSIPVTGWALDDIGVENVKIYREQDGNLVYIGEAVFVEGARPDVEQAYPDYPMNYRAGWGYMMLTNFLPDGGNGTFKIHAIASDTDGNSVDLGTKTINCDNANAVNPFGAIDTPDQGGPASGSNYRNQGWVLTPPPNAMPTDGSTINVYIDGVYKGHPVYNVYRSDIAELFPGYANSSGAHAYFDFDTTAYENGVHTIYWTATDDAGNSDGIGSRYFTIQNSQGARSKEQGEKSSSVSGQWSMVIGGELSQTPVGIIKGFRKDVEPQKIYPDNNGMINISINQLERLEIRLDHSPYSSFIIHTSSFHSGYSGYLVVGDEFKPLPIGSFLDIEKGIFYWQAGHAFIGEYLFMFVVKGPNGAMIWNIKVTIYPKYYY